MEIRGRTVGILSLLLASCLLALVVALEPGHAQEAPRMGGVLKAVMIGEPPSLDLHWTTAVITMPDVAVRLAGVETGEYHFGQQIK